MTNVGMEIFSATREALAREVPDQGAVVVGDDARQMGRFILAPRIPAVPGVAFAPCLLPPGKDARLRYGLGVAVGLLPILPYALAAPGAFYDNIILFNAIRPPDSTSWLAFAPEGAPVAARSIVVALALAVTVHVWRHAPDLNARCALAAALTLAVILAAPTAHHNYQLWWLPFYAVALGATLTRPLGGLQKPAAAL